MAPLDIRKLRENVMKRRIGYQDDDQDGTVISLGKPPDPGTQDDPYSRGVAKIAPPVESPGPEPQLTPGLPGSTGEPVDRFKQWLDDYKSEHEASDNLNDLLKNYPQRERISLARKLTSIGIGMGKGGFKDQKTVLDEPYDRSVEDWKNKTTPAYQAASIERQSNANERQLRGNVLSAQVQTDRIDAYDRANRERARIADDRNRITEENNEARNSLARLKEKNSNIVFDFTGETVKFGDRGSRAVTDTGIKTGRLSEIDRILLNQGGAIAAIQARGDEAVRVKETMPGFNPESVTIRTDAAANRPLTAKEANDARSAELRRIYETDPEGEGRFIKMAPDGVTATLKQRPGYGIPYLWDKANKKEIDEYDALVKRVNESIAPPKGAPANTGSNAVATGQTSAGGMYVLQRDAENPNRQRKSYDGGKTWSYSNDGGKTWDGGQ